MSSRARPMAALQGLQLGADTTLGQKMTIPTRSLPARLTLEASPPIGRHAPCEVALARMIFTMSHPPDESNVPPGKGVAPDEGEGSVVVERQHARTQPPPMFQVVMLNDDYTPMEFVVMVLQQFFQRDLETATQIMLKIHHEGRGVCGVYTKDVAATKVELVLAAARRAGHPLQCITEAA